VEEAMKKACLVLLLIFIVGLMTGEVYTIGTGNFYQGLLPYDGSQGYGWSKIIYTASELNDAGLPAGLIAGIGLYVHNTPVSEPVYNQQLYLRNTVTDVYGVNNNLLPDASAFQNVFSARYIWSGLTWNHLMFNSPFLWDGSSNIEILWRNHDGFATNQPPIFRSTTTLETMSVGTNDYYSFPSNFAGSTFLFRPDIQFITGVSTIPTPAVLVSPAMGSTTTLSTTLRWNAGSGMPASYDVYFGTSPVPPFVANQRANFYNVTGLLRGTTYYWRIVPRNSLGQAANTTVWRFVTVSTNQLVHSFETIVPPPGWVCQGPSNWVRSSHASSDGVTSAMGDGSVAYQYLLSTPKVAITAESTLKFDLLSQFPTAALEIVYSPDRQNWSILQTVSNIDGNTWETKIIDLSSIPGFYFLGFRTPLNDLNFYVDAVIGPILPAFLPGTPVPYNPAQGASNVSIYPIFAWQTPALGSVPSAYNIYLSEGNNPITLIGSTSGNILMLNTPLEYNSTYSWRISAVNEAGESALSQIVNFTTMSDPTINTFPWYVDFGTVAADWPVPDWTQLKGVFPNPASALSQWSRDDWVNVPANNNAARMNVFGTDRCGWLITPPINIPSLDYELQFSLGLTDYTNPSPIEDLNSQLDDKFIVAMSDTRNMANPVILREWNNAGSEYVYNQIPHTGLVSSIPLTGVTGIKYFAFYGESTLPGGDNDLYVDNVTVRRIPTGGNLALSPQVWDFGQVYIDNNANLSVILTNNGIASLTISSATVEGQFFALAETFPPTTLNVGESTTIAINYQPTAAGEHSGTVTFTYGIMSSVLNLTGNCHDPIVASFPWVEDFGTSNADWPIQDWTQFYGPFPTLLQAYDFWEQDEWLNQLSSNNLAAKINVNTANYNAWLITPGCNLDSNGYQLSFDLGLTHINSSDPILSPTTSGTERLVVVMSDDSAMENAVVLREWNNTSSEYRFNNIPHTGTNVIIPLPAGIGVRYFAFYLQCDGGATGNYNDLMIDNVSISRSSESDDNVMLASPQTVLKANYPNPFNPETTITYSLKEAGFVEIQIFNLKGQLVKSLVRDSKAAGEHRVIWNGKDEAGNLVGSGIYLCNLKSGAINLSRKMIMAK